jgi:hypothetical protein
MTKENFEKAKEAIYENSGASVETHPILIVEYSGGGDSGDIEGLWLSQETELVEEGEASFLGLDDESLITLQTTAMDWGNIFWDVIVSEFNPDNDGSSGYSYVDMNSGRVRQAINFYFTDSNYEEFNKTLELT